MNNEELFEAELRRLKPAAPPKAFMARLAVLAPEAPEKKVLARRGRREAVLRILRGLRATEVGDSWRRILRWLIPATAGVGLLVAALAWSGLRPSGEPARAHPPLAAKPALKPNDVQIDRQLVAAYDAVAQLPDGQPVRVRFQQWADDVTLRDSARGIQIEQRLPRFEIVGAKLDTY